MKRFGLRGQLLLISAVVLAIPVGAWQFAREVEQTLRAGHAQGLVDSARAIADSLARDPHPAWSRAEGELFYAQRGQTRLNLDGYADDWAHLDDAAQTFASADERLRVTFSAARMPDGLYLLFRATSPRLAFSDPQRGAGDRLTLAFEHEHPGSPAESSVKLAPLAPGWLADPHTGDADWPRIEGYWQPTRSGWTLEARVSGNPEPTRLGFRIADVDAPGQVPASRRINVAPRALVTTTPALDERLEELAPPGAQAWAVNPQGWVLGRARRLLESPANEPSQAPTWLETLLYEQLLSGRLPVSPERGLDSARLIGPDIGTPQPGAYWSTRAGDPGIELSASAPVMVDGHTLGQVVLRRDADALLLQSNQAVVRLLGLGLGALLLIALVLLGFATVLSERIRRLRDAAESAVASDGRVREVLAPSRAGDELGDLGRSVSSLLGRLGEHQAYLRTLADKLAHELRTPLAMIGSSLDNLEQASDPDQIVRYGQRAREGSDRLNRIFQAMNQAARTEDSIRAEQTERLAIDAWLESYTEACRSTFSGRRFVLEIRGARPVYIDGAPDLLAQALDKLIENAGDVSPVDGRIEITLQARRNTVLLSVENEGPSPAPEVAATLFDSMVSHRSGRSERVHLGLGLYIARLIAEHHGASIAARGTPRGCCIEMRFERA